MQSLQELTRLKRNSAEGEISWQLVIESMIFGAEAEIRWLDHCEAMLSRHRTATTTARSRRRRRTGLSRRRAS